MNGEFNAETTPLQVDVPPAIDASILRHINPEYDILKYSLIEKPLLNNIPAENTLFRLIPIEHLDTAHTLSPVQNVEI